MVSPPQPPPHSLMAPCSPENGKRVAVSTASSCTNRSRSTGMWRRSESAISTCAAAHAPSFPVTVYSHARRAVMARAATGGPAVSSSSGGPACTSLICVRAIPDAAAASNTAGATLSDGWRRLIRADAPQPPRAVSDGRHPTVQATNHWATASTAASSRPTRWRRPARWPAAATPAADIVDAGVTERFSLPASSAAVAAAAAKYPSPHPVAAETSRTASGAAQCSVEPGCSTAANGHVLGCKNSLAPPSEYPVARLSIQVVRNKVFLGSH